MAEGKKDYTVVLSIMDKMAAPLLNLEEKLKHLGHTGEETTKKLSAGPSQKLWAELSEHVGEAREKFADLGENISEMGERLADILPMLGAVGGVGSVAGILELAHATAEASEALADMSKITGETVPELQQIEYAAKQVGVPLDQVSTGFERVNVSIARAASGQDKISASLFKAMGISLKDAHGHIKTLDEILPQLESSFAKTKDPALRAAMAMQLFGRSGEEMLPLLTEGADKLEDYKRQFQEFGYTFTGEDQEGLEKFNEAWKEAELSMQGLADSIGSKLAPVMAPLLEEFATFIAKNREWITLDVEHAVNKVATAVERIDLHGVIVDVEQFTQDVGSVIDRIGGMQNAMIAAGAVMAGAFLAPVIELTGALIELGVSMAIGVAAPVAALGLSFIKLVPEVKNLRDVMAALDLAMDANPIGVMVLTAAAAGVAIYELWDHWKDFKTGVVTIWNGIDTAFHKVFDPIGEVIDNISQKINQAEEYLHITGHGSPSQDSTGRPVYSSGHGAAHPLPFLPPAGQGVASPNMTQTVTVVNPVPGSYIEHKGLGGAPLPVVKQNVGLNGTLSGSQ